MNEFKAALVSAMDRQGVTDNDVRAMIAAICMGESNMVGHSETGYAHTSNDRIRKVFGERVSGLSDAQLNELKADDEKWFDFIYSSSNSVGRMLGNRDQGDGYAFRGRGIIQLTGRGNYQHFGQEIGVDLLSDPEKANDPEIAAELVVAYIDERWQTGTDFASMMKCVGNNTPDIRERKEGFYEQFKSDGEFDYVQPPVAPVVSQPEQSIGVVSQIEHTVGAGAVAVRDWLSEL